MNRYILVWLILCAFMAGCCNPGMIGAQPVTLKAQETNMWCWAASGEMVMDFLGTNVTQCDQANKRFGRNDCCNTPTPNACINGGWPEFDKYGFTFNTTANAALTGSPAFDYKSSLKSQAIFRNLPQLQQRLLKLEEMVEEMTALLDSQNITIKK